ncbi:electron transport complex subunit RsxD [Pseudoalteromonas sp. T1lg88]|uniref:electron transport complex subunit RsxD n=1 Tax=Pseudoalteromonas sp. T1lg88 TaxID=2077104 RepID=UPI000CF7465E|nr:electron transport complex subunit RsxD [Pseudoalteromonas sp. T1lg88]
MNLNMMSSPYKHSHKSLTSVMMLVTLAAVPGILAQCYFFGAGVLIQLALALVCVTLFEAGVLYLRGRKIWHTLQDGSAWLTGLLLAVSIPPLAPWWVIVIGTFFAIVFVKQLYGGLGGNLFNPAMAGYVLLLVSFPVQMTSWLPPAELMHHQVGLLDELSMIFSNYSQSGYSLEQLRSNVDGITMATPLDTLRTDVSHGLTVAESMTKPVFTETAGLGWQWVNAAYLLGGLFLLQQRVINWHIPVAMLAALSLCASIGYIFDSGNQPGLAFHLLSGATMLGAFFIATDPVSASTTNRGRLIYGAAIGVIVYLIRSFGGYPDAVAFAVLLMNMAVPLIDHYTQPRTYGYGAKS